MNNDEFWRLVDAANKKAGDDTNARVEALEGVLSGLTPAELQSFQSHYDQKIIESYSWNLWGAAYVIGGGCGDDGFRYFRDWLISEGKVIYEKALADPDSLADLPHIDLSELEAFGYGAMELFERADAGKMERDFEGADPTGEPWEEDSVGELFPRLNAIYG